MGHQSYKVPKISSDTLVLNIVKKNVMIAYDNEEEEEEEEEEL
jgi:hypothetical protein